MCFPFYKVTISLSYRMWLLNHYTHLWMITQSGRILKTLLSIESIYFDKKSKIYPSSKDYSNKLEVLDKFLENETRISKRSLPSLLKMIKVLFNILCQRKIKAFENASQTINSADPSGISNLPRILGFSAEMISYLRAYFNLLHYENEVFSDTDLCKLILSLIEVHKAQTIDAENKIGSLNSSSSSKERETENKSSKSRRRREAIARVRAAAAAEEARRRKGIERRERVRTNRMFRKLFTQDIELESIE